jgi:hypothetical protein
MRKRKKNRYVCCLESSSLSCDDAGDGFEGATALACFFLPMVRTGTAEYAKRHREPLGGRQEKEIRSVNYYATRAGSSDTPLTQSIHQADNDTGRKSTCQRAQKG